MFYGTQRKCLRTLHVRYYEQTGSTGVHIHRRANASSRWRAVRQLLDGRREQCLASCHPAGSGLCDHSIVRFFSCPKRHKSCLLHPTLCSPRACKYAEVARVDPSAYIHLFHPKSAPPLLLSIITIAIRTLTSRINIHHPWQRLPRTRIMLRQSHNPHPPLQQRSHNFTQSMVELRHHRRHKLVPASFHIRPQFVREDRRRLLEIRQFQFHVVLSCLI